MTQQLADRVKETTTTAGTGALSLAGAMTGFQAFSSICAVGDTTYYALQSVDSNGNPTGAWEVGLGTYSAAATLTRTTILASSNAGALVDLPGGTAQVWMDAPAILLGGLQKPLGVIAVQENEASGVAGGSSVAGTQTRVLNTVVANTIAGASLSANQITLPAGTYMVQASAPACQVGTHQISLYSVSSGTTQLLGTSEDSAASTIVTTRSFISGVLTLTGTTVVRINHYTPTAYSGTGLGRAASSGLGEVYTQVLITKLA